MNAAIIWSVTLVAGLMSVIAVAGLSYAILYTAHAVRRSLAEAHASGVQKEPAMVLSWLTIVVATILIIALVGFLISAIMALAQAPLDMASFGAASD
jgi:heme/copper-type cytochrome/quinol oxidase subunit 2